MNRINIGMAAAVLAALFVGAAYAVSNMTSTLGPKWNQ